MDVKLVFGKIIGQTKGRFAICFRECSLYLLIKKVKLRSLRVTYRENGCGELYLEEGCSDGSFNSEIIFALF